MPVALVGLSVQLDTFGSASDAARRELAERYSKKLPSAGLCGGSARVLGPDCVLAPVLDALWPQPLGLDNAADPGGGHTMKLVSRPQAPLTITVHDETTCDPPTKSALRWSIGVAPRPPLHEGCVRRNAGFRPALARRV